MGKNKLARWAEMKSFDNVFQPETEQVKGKDYPLKGRWKEQYFRNNNPLVLELGCGKGEYTVEMAVRCRAKNYIGIDIKGARIWKGAKIAFENKIANAAFIRTRIEFINSFFSDDEVDEIWITFPDPHPKTRNTKKRLTGPFFLNSYRSLLKNGGILHLKTDNEDLFSYTTEIIKQNDLELITSTKDLYSGNIENEFASIKTFYENSFLKEGKKIHYIEFRLDKYRRITGAE